MAGAFEHVHTVQSGQHLRERLEALLHAGKAEDVVARAADKERWLSDLSAESIERRRQELLRRIKEGGPIAKGVLREIFPNSIQLQPDDSGKHLWAVFVYDEGATRINLLYDTAEERINAEIAATLAAFQANAERVGINGSGGPISLPATVVRWSLAA